MATVGIINRVARLTLALPLLIGAGCDKSTDEGKADEGKAELKAEAKAETKEAPAANLPDAAELLAKSVEAAGGTAAFAKIKSFTYEGHLVVVGQKLEARSSVWWKEGDFYTEQDMIGVGQMRAGKKGEVIWSEDPINGLRQLSGTEAEQVTWLSTLMLAADWKRFFSKAETTKEVSEDGKKLYIVKLTADSGADVELKLDAETGLQHGLSLTNVTPMGEIPTSVTMSDYREVDGIKLPFKHTQKMPLASAILEVSEFKLNPEVSDARFQMPRADADVVRKKAVGQ